MNEFLEQNRVALEKVKQRFKDNAQRFFVKVYLALQFLICAAILDAFSTFCFSICAGC
ncbi:MAG: hypothetical protein HRT88_11045 [Lentisphaeraceae bacterium]|nr:hypothetical protein [Lentisphaeraceae bacterium]